MLCADSMAGATERPADPITIGRAEAVVPFTLNHEVDVAETMLEFELACRASAHPIELVDQDRLLTTFPAGRARRQSLSACELSVRLPHLSKPIDLTVIPDRIFCLLYPDGTRHIAWSRPQLDRGTMSVGTDVRASSENRLHPGK